MYVNLISSLLSSCARTRNHSQHLILRLPLFIVVTSFRVMVSFRNLASRPATTTDSKTESPLGPDNVELEFKGNWSGRLVSFSLC